MQVEDREGEIAVIGLSCRFPGADDPLHYWKNLCAGVESITVFSDQERLESGTPPELVGDPSIVPAYGAVARPYAFDAPFFGVSQREAQAMDPQQRVFLECAWSALEDAGYYPGRFADSIGVFAGSGSSNYLARVQACPDLAAALGQAAVIANKADFLTTRVSYKLGLRGPSVTVLTACSTSLVSIHVACQSLLGFECEMALAGGVTIVPDPDGYRYQEGGIHSPDGHCRAFDARSAGTVPGSGSGVVVLKRMADALRDGDTIRAVIKGSAINNDGAGKVGFAAPSVRGQAQAITEAYAVAGVDPSTVTYVEAHGTGTPLGDPVEVAALTQAFGAATRRTGFCALGAVKGNVGHLDCAAGVAGFIKTVLALEHRTLPPTLHFTRPNPETGLEGSPFYVNAALAEWPAGETPRRAGVSAFGIGGTNAHAVLEEAPELPPLPDGDGAELLVLSARTPAALEEMRGKLGAHLAEHPALRLRDVAATLQEGRAEHSHRWAAVARGAGEARVALAGTSISPSNTRQASARPPVVFLFPGGGTQYPGMGRELYEREPVFRREIDACAAAAAGVVGLDLRTFLFPAAGKDDEARELMEQIRYALPALFSVEYALAQLWMSWGVRPEAMLGHSMGEYVAACIAGVFTRESAVRLVAARAALMQSAPSGSMLAVPMPEAELRPLLSAGLALAAVNSASNCVVSGATAEIDAIEAVLAGRGVVARRLHVSAASHSPAMDPILEAFAAEVRQACPAAPTLPFLSNVTGEWITAEQATDPGYWVSHLRQTVRFADGARRLLESPDRVFLEVGPGDALGTFVRRDGGAGRVVVRSLAAADKPEAADRALLGAAGALWTAGVELEWASLRRGEPWRRVPLPTYPFDRTEYRVPPLPRAAATPAAAAPAASASDSRPQQSRLSAPPTLPEPISEPVAIETSRPSQRLSRIAGTVAEIFARLLGATPGELEGSRTFLELGADSLLLMQASRTVESTFGVRVPFRKLLEGLNTIDGLTAHLDGVLPPDPEPAEAPAPEPALAAAAVQPEPVADLAVPLRMTVTAGAARVSHGAAEHASNGHGSNGHGSNGGSNGHGPNGHGTNGHGTNGHGTNGHTADGHAAGHAPVVLAGVHDVLARQLDVLQTVMQQQMEILRGGAVLSAPAIAPVTTSAPVSNGHATNGGSTPHATNGASTVTTSASASPAGSTALAGSTAHAGSTALAGSTAHVVSTAPVGSASPAAAAAVAAPEAPASHGPHRPVRQTMATGGGYTERQARHFDELVRGYNERTRGSKAYTAENRPWLADNRAVLGFRLATKELLYPIVGARSEGSRIWDVDGNEYVDFTGGFGVHFFGHRPPFIVEAVEAQLRNGFHLGPQSDLAGPAARLLRELAGVERVTFCNTGSDAIATAMRIARTATGRDLIAMFEGGYHGGFDGVLARPGGVRDGRPRSLPAAPGTPPAMVDDVVVLPYGAPEALEWLRANAGSLAAVLVEPVQSRNPELLPREFLHEVRALTRQSGTVLVFDEMITGLRVGVRGAQGYFGVDADLATYGKVIGGGFPIGVVAGRAELMDAIDGGQWQYGDDSYPAADQTFFAGTFCKHPVAMAAACAVLRHLKERGPALYDELNARADRLVAALREVIDREQAPIRILQFASFFQFRLEPKAPIGELIFHHMVQRGVYIWEGRGCFLSTAHTDEDCDRLVRALEDSLHALREGGFLPDLPGGGGAPPSPGGVSVPPDLKLFPAGSVSSERSSNASPRTSADAASGNACDRSSEASSGVEAGAGPRSFPLTPAQKQIWVHAQLGDDASRAYNEQNVLALRGPFDPAHMRAALEDVMRHHESLRTLFDASGEVQHVFPDLAPDFRIEAPVPDDDPQALARALRDAVRQVFDLRADPPIRIHVHPRGPERNVVQIVFHHVAVDGLGFALLMRDLEAAYRARRGGEVARLEPAMQFGEYAALVAEHARAHAGDEATWLARFEGAVPLELPTDHQRPRFPTNPAAQARLTLAAPLVASLRAAGRREGLTLFNTLLGGVLALLHRTAGQDDLVVGIPSAGRPFPGSDTLVGNCVDVLPIRSRVGRDTGLLPFLKEVRGRLLDAYEHESFSLARLAEKLEIRRGPSLPALVSVSFNLEPGGGGEGGGPPRFAGHALEPAGSHNLFTKVDIGIDAVERGGEIDLVWLFNTDLFERGTIERMLGHLERVLEQVAAGAAAPVLALDVMGDGERAQVLGEWNDTRRAYPAAPVHHLFAEQARRAPAAAAVLHGERSVTYGELDARSSALAARLRALGVGPEARVGLCVERAPELLVGVLGIWKAGGAYVPLDPGYPAERLAWIARDAALPVIVTTANASAAIPPEHAAAIVRLDEIDGLAGDDASEAAVTPENLAYVIYTSGSTGKPKGVMVRHGALANLLGAAREAYGVAAGDVMPAMASFAFDIWLFEALAPLVSGGAVRLVDRDRMIDVPALLDEIADTTLLSAVTPLMRQIARVERDARRLTRVRSALVGGEVVTADLLAEMREAFPGAELHVLYGPTEAAVLASNHLAPAGETIRGNLIGRPLGNVRLYVADARGEPQPVGVPGELLIGGAGVARGYLGRPGLTAERFVPDPFAGEPGARLYRTGDRARWRAGGEVEFLGRLDAQVKVRGFRIEPGEIEAALRRHPGVSECVVIAREDEPDDRRLAAYVVPVPHGAAGASPAAGADGASIDNGGESLPAALRAYLRQSLPGHMVPGAIVVLERLPLTPNGKVDRRALPAPSHDGGDGYQPARTATEEVLAGIWARVLGTGRVGIRESFFELGGHSLLATKVVSRVREVFGVDLPVRTLFNAPTVAEAALAVEALRRAGLPLVPPVVPVPRGGGLPLSFAQERLWFLDRLEPGNALYNIPAGLRLGGELHVAALERALGEVVRRHEVLRTTFADAPSGPVQVIAPFAGFTLPVEDLSALAGEEREAEVDRRFGDEAAHPFDLARGPLFRARLLRLGEREHVLLLAMHHVASDGWSMGVLFRELSALYEAYLGGAESPLAELPVQYGDYAAWQREHMAGEALERELAYWRGQLAGAPAVLELPADHVRPAVPSYRGEFEPMRLPAELLERLRALARAEGATLYMVLLGAFQLLLSRYGGSDDVVVGSPVAGRTRAQVEALIGFFVNTLVLRTDLSGDPSFGELLRRVREVTLGAYEHQEVPFEKLVEALRPERSLSHSPLFQVTFTLQEGGGPALRLPGLDTRAAGAGAPPAKFDLSLELAVTPAGVAGGITYAADLFDRGTIQRMLAHLGRVLEQVAADPGVRLSRVRLAGGDERRMLVDEWNRTARPFPRGACIHELFAAQVRARPEAPALVWDGVAVSYALLDERANRLAHHLVKLGVGPEARVGVMLERGPELIVAILAIVKAGGCYLPLDPEYPAERLELMLADAGARVLVTRGGPAAEAVRCAGPTVDLGQAAAAIALEPAHAPPCGATPANLAYVVYTSGSTGRPKGVMVAHREVVQLVIETDYVRLRPGDRVAQASNASFDALTFEAWGALLNGATLVGLPKHVLLSPPALRETLREQRITTLYQTTALLNQLTREQPDVFATLREVLFGGQASDAERVRALLRSGKPARLLHVYGPTETTAWCTYEQVEQVPQGAPTVSVGRPIGNARIYVLDAALEPVPVGVPGEAYVGGDGVVRGYLDRPALTAGRFVPDPFSSEPGARMYRTGDRLRWKADGTLEFLGRLDQQVKLRGFRIEPGEVESALAAHPGVGEARVIARRDETGDTRLVAYVVGTASGEALRAHLRPRMPEYMVPSAFVTLDRLPLTPSGKLDVKALPAPEFGGDAASHVAPETPVEEVLAGIWAEVLRVERVGRHEGFFDLGGHSLLATRVVSRVREVFGVELPLRAMFEGPTVAELAGRVEALLRAGLPALPPVVPVERTGPLPLSFGQERLWVLDRLGQGGAAYNIPTARRISGALDTAALERALGEIVRRHEALRTTFSEVDGAPVQVIAPFGGFALPVEDVTASEGADREAQARRIVAEEAARPFDLAAGPLFRARLVRLGEGDHLLLLSLHHVAGDGWSVDVLFRELSALYAAYREGRESPLAPLPVQYADYAAWQRTHLAGEALERQLAWWTARLAGAPELLELPTDRPRPAVQSSRGAAEPLRLAPELLERLRAVGRREGATLYMVVLGAFQALLGRYAGSRDVVVGTTIAGRTRREVEPLVGLFMNTLVLRTGLGDDPTFRGVLRRVREVTLGAYEHQDVPFEKLVAELRPERSLSHSPLFQVLFELHDQGGSAANGGLAGLEVRGIGVEMETVKYDLSVALAATPGGLEGGLIYSTDLFDRATIQRMAGHLGRVLEQVAADPDVRISAIDLLGAGERQVVVEAWNQTAAEFPADRCIHQLFEAQAARTPDAAAVVFGNQALAYREVDERANRIARHLVRLGVGPEERVGICLERGPELIPAILGVMKAGGAWVPVDPSHPAERIGYVLGDAGVSVVLTQTRLSGKLPPIPIIRLDRADDAAAIAAERADAPETAVTPANLCYVIYTSGSTGRPKGVAMHHQGVANYIHWGTRAYRAGEGNGAPVFSSLAVDLTITNLLPLFAGKPVHLLAEENAVEALAAALRQKPGFGMIKITPTHLSLLTPLLSENEAREAAHTLVVGADFLPAEPTVWWQDHAPGVRLMNEYGPTETVVGCSAYTLPNGVHRTGPVPVGGPIQNLGFYVLDAEMNPVPVGLPGELYIGGVGVARGYLGRPRLSAEKFVPNPFGAAGARMYRTGDRARWQADGKLLILGRGDDQVKLRGYRVELGEVEAVLRLHPSVADAVAVVREDRPGDRRLVAYVTGDADAAILREHALRTLPEYMVPGAFVRLDSLPLTSTGKFDRKALPAPEYAPAGEYAAPATPVEEVLAEIWAEVLGHQRVGVADNFFALGGDSILCMQVVSRARRAGLDLTPRQIFEYQTVAELASVAGARAGVLLAPDAGHDRPGGPVRLTPIQAWFFEQENPAPWHYNQSTLLAVPAAVSDAALEVALAAVVAHHDALRLRYRRADGGWEQWHAPEAAIALERVDLSALDADEQERVQGEISAERQASLRLEDGPLGRAVLFDRGQRGRDLLLVLHHLVVDAVSWSILRDDLERACALAEAGEPVDLGAKGTSFARWARALEAYAASDALAAEAAHWLAQGADGDERLPADGSGEGTLGAAQTVTVSLDAGETRALLHEVPAAYRTQANDALLCALAGAVGEWTGSTRVRLALEGHGREEEIAAGADLTRTVGWFTSVYPVVLDLAGAAGPGERLKRVKEQLRAVPRRGIGYGVLRYLSADAEVRRALAAHPEPEIVFNYLGQMDSGSAAAARFATAAGPRGRGSAAANRRAHLLEVNGWVDGGRLRLEWTYGEGTHRAETIERVAGAYLAALRELIAHCREDGAGGCTPSDFPLAGLAHDELTALLGDARGVEDLYPLSPMQEGMLFHALSGGETQAYQVEVAYRLEGSLDVERFQRAWAEVVARHAILRTSFAWEGLRRPLQRVHAAAALPWQVEDWRALAGDEQERALARYLADDRLRGFDLRQAPLMRCALFQLDDHAHWFVWSQHHLLTDGWAGARVLDEVFRLYRGWSAGEPVQLRRVRPYRDYIAWLLRQSGDAAERYWRGVLEGFTAPTPLPFATPAATGAARPARHAAWLSRELTQRLEAFAREQRVTLNTLLLGVWGVLLARYGGEDDVVFGTTVLGRPPALAGADEMIGLFINTLPVRLRVGGGERLGAWLRGVQRMQAEARDHEHASLVQVQGWSEVPRGTPLFESHFIFENHAIERRGHEAPAAGLRVSEARGTEWNSYPLSLLIGPGPELLYAISYDESRFDAGTVRRMGEHLEWVLEQVAANPAVRVSELTLTTPAERRRVVEEWNAQAVEFPAGRCVHQLFEAQAERTPDAVAVVFGNQTQTYRELDERANRLAHHLARLGVGREVRVGLCLERGLEVMPAILGVMKAGGAWVPVDPAHPAERIGYLLNDAGVAVLLTQERLRDRLPGTPGIAVVAVDTAWPEIAGEPARAPRSAVTAENLAYVIYTSGSTGRPKGVAMHHRGVCNYIHWGVRAYGAGEGNGAPVFTSLAVDLTITNLLPLFAGKPVRFLAEENPVEALAAALREKPGFGMIKITPTHLSLLTPLLSENEAREAAHTLVVGADFLPAEPTVWWQDNAPGVRLMNEYGPTETVVGCSAYTLPNGAHRTGPVPVGGPIQNLAFYVLDGEMNPVPVGLPGELFIAGAGVARGYLGRPGLSAEKFVPDPFVGGGARMYRTGDRARWLEGGNLLILGRSDNQVKLRGYRVELGEVEAVLRLHPSVADAVAVVREDRPGDRRLVAYVTGDADSAMLREHALRTLPEYMVPGAFVRLDSLPLTSTGKFDRRSLPAPEYASSAGYVAPSTPVEEALAAIWAGVLGHERVGVNDDFFELGGHSLLVMRLTGQVQAAFGVDLSIRTVFSISALGPMAAEIERMIYEDISAMPELDAEQLAALHAELGDARAV